MNATQEHEKGPLLQGYSSWRAKGEQTLLSVTQSLVAASRRRANTALCREVRFLTPKTQFSSTLIPKFDRKLNL